MWGLRAPARCITAPQGAPEGRAEGHRLNLTVVRKNRAGHFLTMISPTPVTPSEVVDEVWHQHLIYSRDYWTIWCGERLQAPLHHDPTPGGPEAQMIYRRQYAETLALHERVFGPPGSELWPATHLRFGRPRFHVTDRSRWLITPRPFAWIRRLFRR